LICIDSGSSVTRLQGPITGRYPEPAESILRFHTLSLQSVLLSAFHRGDRLMLSDQNFVPISQFSHACCALPHSSSFFLIESPGQW